VETDEEKNDRHIARNERIAEGSAYEYIPNPNVCLSCGLPLTLTDRIASKRYQCAECYGGWNNEKAK